MEFDLALGGVKFYEPNFDTFLNSPVGEVGQHLRKVGRRIELAAVRDVGVDTGQLQSDIYMVHDRVGLFQEVRIGADNEIALMHHEGTRPHVITPGAGHQYMRFSTGTRVVYTKRVMHPGTEPNRFLSDNLRLAFL